jgi:hypothetical protein
MATTGDVVHVGLNKTATTWLQQSVFPLVESHRLVGRKAPPDRAVLDAIGRMQSAAAPDPARSLRAAVDAAVSDQRPVVLTDEGLVSTLRYGSWAACVRTAERLHAQLPDATVLLVIRRQAELVRSSYRQYVKMGGVASLRRFCAGEPLDGYVPYPQRYDLCAIYECFRDVYGAERVVVVPFERLVEDPGSFLDDLCARLDLRLAAGSRRAVLSSSARNESASWTGTFLLRSLNRLVSSRPFHPRRFLPSVSPRRTHRWVRALDRRIAPVRQGLDRRRDVEDRALLRRVQAAYVPGNRRLAEMTGLDLGAMGYFEEGG